jgi:hypothetical protein
MKIRMEKNGIEFVPENSQEKAQLGTLWMDCVKFQRQLVPMGECLSPEVDFARFALRYQHGSNSTQKEWRNHAESTSGLQQ